MANHNDHRRRRRTWNQARMPPSATAEEQLLISVEIDSYAKPGTDDIDDLLHCGRRNGRIHR
jgi:hypothetical protein